MDASLATKTAIPFKEEEVKGPDGKKIGVIKTWYNDTGKPLELNPPGIVIQPKTGLRIEVDGSVALLSELKAAPKPAPAPIAAAPKAAPAPAKPGDK